MPPTTRPGCPPADVGPVRTGFRRAAHPMARVSTEVEAVPSSGSWPRHHACAVRNPGRPRLRSRPRSSAPRTRPGGNDAVAAPGLARPREPREDPLAECLAWTAARYGDWFTQDPVTVRWAIDPAPASLRPPTGLLWVPVRYVP
ncbi:hypothetical protein ACH4GP_34345 [Streptomyces celluloflavus]|uniref:Erythromycin biosynthesis protein CIII-like N-terminal domain-containing protein n=1 Tax=Streptomyces celluloflavus TaxID=58344 RepID=A0ABW7RQD1_9ACTN